MAQSRSLVSVQPAGMVSYFANSSAPSGWLKADGSAVSRTTYSDLFAAIGTTFGSGNGSTTFNVPDLRGYFTRGWSDGSSVDSGRTFGSAQDDAFQGHGHTILMRGNAEGGGNTNEGGDSNTPYAYSSDTAVTTPVSDGTNGTPRVTSETRPKNIALLACIKF